MGEGENEHICRERISVSAVGAVVGVTAAAAAAAPMLLRVFRWIRSPRVVVQGSQPLEHERIPLDLWSWFRPSRRWKIRQSSSRPVRAEINS